MRTAVLNGVRNVSIVMPKNPIKSDVIKAALKEIFPAAIGFLLKSPSFMSVSISKQLFRPNVKARKQEIVARLIGIILIFDTLVKSSCIFSIKGRSDKPR